jgi:hypothetical protein
MRYRFSSLNPDDAQLRISIQGLLSGLPDDPQEVHFLRTWLTYDSGSEEGKGGHAILGLVLVFGVSASFWSGVGLAVAQVLK